MHNDKKCSRCDEKAERIYCSYCERVLDSALVHLPQLFKALSAALHPSGGPGERVSGTRTPGPPVRTTILALMQEAARMVCGLEDAVRASQSAKGRLRAIPGWTYHLRGAPAALAYLQANQRHLLGLDPDAGDRLIELRLGIERALGLAPLVHRLPVPCPSCTGQLIRRDGEERIHCVECARIWEWEDYQWLCRTTVDEMPA